MAVIDISREDVLCVLESMGIKLHDNNKLSLEQLETRLDKALDASQQIEELFTQKHVSPDDFPKWRPDKPLFEATARYNAAEVLKAGAITTPKKAEHAKREDTFKELRQTIWALAFACEGNAPAIFLINKDQQNAIFIRVTGVHEVPGRNEFQNDTPLFYVVFSEVTPTLEMTMTEYIKRLSNGDNAEMIPVGNLESYLLLRLLRKNSKKLDPSYRHLAGENSPNKILIKSSFLLPLNALSQQTLGAAKLSDSGCYVCGNKTNSRCQGCYIATYCSKECQVGDWKMHKVACKSLRGGTWHQITLSSLGQLGPGLTPKPYAQILGYTELGSGGLRSSSNESNTSHPHKDKVFLAKFQVPLTGTKPTQMLVYDRQRSIQRNWHRSSGTPELFDKAVDIIGERYKFYRWMRYVEGDQYEICLDRAPADPTW